ncbi:MAG: glutamate 5-kinase [Deltaproteobacteria bacterium]|nr:glutamate 5-kinase [Deltaproteobacteria bacterium]
MVTLKKIIRKVRRVVIKIGTSVLLDDKGRLSPKALGGIASGIAFIQKKGIRVILVTSGAIPLGMQHLRLSKRPHQIGELQACAAIGQPILMGLYQKSLQRHRLHVAQVLLTRNDLEDRARFLNAKHALTALLHQGIMPIINENDTVVTEEIRFGDNDNLAALVTNVIEADLLVLLTDRDGFYTADPDHDPEAKIIPVVENVDDDFFSYASDTAKNISIGGMKTKLEAAHKAGQFGVPTVIANGRDANTLKKIFLDESVGTLFLPRVDPLVARKHWIAYTLKPQGRLVVDGGAVQALVTGKKSLLASGVLEVQGKFSQGDPVDLNDPSGKTIARGLISYNSEEVTQIKGKKTSEFEKVLGYKGPDELIHRDDLVLL